MRRPKTATDADRRVGIRPRTRRLKLGLTLQQCAAVLAQHVHDMGDRVRTLDSFAAMVTIGSADLDVERAMASWSAGRAQP